MMNNLKKISLMLILWGLYYQFCYACGGEHEPTPMNLILGLGLWTFFIVIYLLPSVYYFLRYKKYQLSILNLLIPHLAFIALGLLSRFYYELGLNPLIYKVLAYIPVAILLLVFCLIGLLLWAYPAFYAYHKEMNTQQH